ncbi:MAG: RnfABCDGE type electron transport complex subunit D [Eubacteriales bacterium]|nr:RnfABCDGE type electron transport complex subunit D [Eubacteriales bacterium]
MYDFSKVVITSSPHIKSKEDTQSIMLDVLIALIPSLAVSTYVFGFRAILMTAVSVIACMVFEAIYDKIVGKPNTIMDLSAAVTGVLLAFVCPVTLPYWMLIIGDGIAIIFAKCLFGGLGKNFMNPALAGRAFLLASWPVAMTTWAAARSSIGLISNSQETLDAISQATPLAIIKGTAEGDLPGIASMFLGMCGGSMGEVSAVALLIGGAYLLMRKVITIHTPAAYILTVAVIAFIFPMGDLGHMESLAYSVFSGGLMLGAIFMATDYSTTPVSKKGQVIFGIGCGLLTTMIRYFGGYPEGVCYSILLMNTTVWLIDKYTRPTKFGAPAKQKKEG